LLIPFSYLDSGREHYDRAGGMPDAVLGHGTQDLMQLARVAVTAKGEEVGAARRPGEHMSWIAFDGRTRDRHAST
jgi:hypothetical protein